MSTIATKSNPKLWESIKNKVIKGSRGGPPGKSSARKMQLATLEYNAKGGGYKGKKSSTNSLVKWSREKWDYISSSGRKSKTGRYLPEKVRKMLSPSEKKKENKLKGSRKGKWVSYSPSVLKKMRSAGIIRKSRK